MQNSITILVEKLDAFIRKYYKNLLIRGSLLTCSVILFEYLCIVLIDFFFALDTTARSFFFYTFIFTILTALGFWVIDPLIRYYRLGKVISYEKAALIIGEHFTAIKDKVLNTLQLDQQTKVSQSQIDLVTASIQQRIRELKPIPFTSAIDLTLNKKYLRFLLPPVFAGLFILFAAPSILTEGTFRLLNYNVVISLTVPYQFIIENESMEVVEQSDFELKVKVQGTTIPDQLYIQTEQASYRMEKVDKLHFKYVFTNVRGKTNFFIKADEVYKEKHTITTIPNPTLLSLEVKLDFPFYTGMTSKTIPNSGDLSVPEGTQVKWLLKTRNTDELTIKLPDTTFKLKQNTADQFVFSSRLMKSGTYTIRTNNKFTSGKEDVTYFLNVIPDQSPAISVDEKIDSLSVKRRFFIGDIGDDYGFTRLSFNYRFLQSGDTTNSTALTTIELPINRKTTADQFIYYWDLSKLNISAGDQIEYYFVVSDNDGIHGSKSTKSATRLFRAPTLEEISANTDKNNDHIKSELERALKETQKLNKDIKQAKQEMLEKKNMDWQDKNKLENLMERQQNLQKQIEDIKKQNKENNLQKTEYTEMDEKLLEKQKELEELFDKIMTEDMKKLYEELQKLLDLLEKDKVQEKLENFDLSNKDLEKELDRTLELFKQMEMEQKMQELVDKLDKLSEEQKQLSEESKDKKSNKEELAKKQEELNKKFDDVKKDLEKLKELNEDLEKKKDLSNTDEKQDKIDQEMKNSSEELSKNEKKKASDSQKKASEEMKDLQNMLSQMMQDMQSQQNEEDMDAIRSLLENLIQLSFDQEELMKEFSKTSPRDPKYVKLGQQQRKLKDDAKIIEDSLFALSKRQASISPIVNKEMSAINKNMSDALNNIGERLTSQAGSNQQYVMTSLNNLALMLDQALQSMQQQQMNSSGGGACNKPGKPKPGQGAKPGKGKSEGQGESMQSIKKMQEELAKSLEELKKQLEEGGNKPGQKPGQGGQGNNGQPGLSKELAELAAKQEAIRRKLLEMSNELNKDGSGAGNGLKKIAEQMEKNEKDIVNKNINRETLFRQQDIMTKLLESEKAMREREMDEKRQSNESKNEEISNSFEFLEYKRQKEKELELMRTIPPTLTPYYKNRVNEYFNIIER